jgi:uncharacterized membrane protein YbhN (UPF0104 family)
MNNAKHTLTYLKWLISISSIAFIVYKLSQLSQQEWLLLHTAFLKNASIKLFTAIILFMLLNWSVEAIKWKILVRFVQPQSLFIAIKSVFIGVTIGLFTPNRAGELIGRVYYLDDDKKIRASLLNLAGSVTQVACTFIFGLIALLFFKDNWLAKVPFTMLMSLLILLLIVCFAAYYVIRNNRVFMNILDEIFVPFKRITLKTMLQVLGLSMFRYGIFTLQFILVLHLFEIHLPVVDMIICIAVNYFLITAIPTYALAEIGVRGSVAAAVFGVYGIEALPVISASLIIWIVNLAVPSIIGTVILMKE